MLKFVKVALSASALFVAQQGYASTDINASLQNVCSNAKQQASSQLHGKMNSVQKGYNAKLANYYTGISCNGKSLINVSLASLQIKPGDVVRNKTLN